MRRMSACRQPLTGTSIRRYFPPIGTAGFERVAVSGKRREPCPPPRMMASVSLVMVCIAVTCNPPAGVPRLPVDQVGPAGSEAIRPSRTLGSAGLVR